MQTKGKTKSSGAKIKLMNGHVFNQGTMNFVSLLPTFVYYLVFSSQMKGYFSEARLFVCLRQEYSQYSLSLRSCSYLKENIFQLKSTKEFHVVLCNFLSTIDTGRAVKYPCALKMRLRVDVNCTFFHGNWERWRGREHWGIINGARKPTVSARKKNQKENALMQLA